MIEIKGISDLQKALNKLPAEMQKTVEVSALRDGGKQILAAAKSKCPTGDNGLLKKSLGVTVRKNKRGAMRGKYTARIGARSGFAITKGNKRIDPSKYSHLVELGTSHSAAKPFIRPAIEAASDKVVGALIEGYDRGLSRAVAKLRKK